jgi:D-alanyl-D-alanine dipeptidase
MSGHYFAPKFRLPCQIGIVILLFLSAHAQECKDTTAMDNKLKKLGLVNVQALDNTIQVDLRFSSTNNPLKKDAYGDFCNCYLQKEAALKLVKAQKKLQKLKPGYSLLTFDCLRPRSFQRKIYDLVQGTKHQRYVANPNTGSMHNYGCAVDISIVDENGKELDMGTEYCYFGDLAQPRYEKKFLKEGKLNREHIKNRELLRTVMKKAGFNGILIEWWHFNAFPKKHIRKTYQIVE